jgi:hypothetical protein
MTVPGGRLPKRLRSQARTRWRARRLVAFTLIAPFAALLAGCGYTQSNYSGGPTADGAGGPTARSLYRGDVRTVAVPIFTNRSFERNLEFELSKAVVNYLESSTPYKVVPKERADTILEGEITFVDIDTVSNSAFTATPQEQLMTVRVNFTWKDLRTGRILAQRKRFDQSGTYYPTLGEGRFVGAQQNVERLAVAIVQELQADW